MVTLRAREPSPERPSLVGENIICFAKDWSEDPTSNNHIMRGLARDNHVLWLNSIATRAPSLTSSRDLHKIATKVRGFARGPVQVAPGLEVYTPIVLPFPHHPLAVQVNEQILRTSLDVLRRRRGMRDFQLWSFLPTAASFLGKLGESFVVYYCTDEWSQFSHLDGDRVRELERQMCTHADLVFATSTTLLEAKRELNRETHLALHGVDQAHFAQALAPETELAPEVRDVGHPVVGFVGLLQDWVDIALIRELAVRRRDWTFVLVGKALTDVSSLERLPNVRLLGRKPYAELPRYLKAFDVGIIPFVENELTRHVNPIKLREYLSAGLPVVSSHLPEVARYIRTTPAIAGSCEVAEDVDAFEVAIAHALAHDSPALRRQRSEAMRAETWEHKIAAIGQHVQRVRLARN